MTTRIVRSLSRRLKVLTMSQMMETNFRSALLQLEMLDHRSSEKLFVERLMCSSTQIEDDNVIPQPPLGDCQQPSTTAVCRAEAGRQARLVEMQYDLVLASNIDHEVATWWGHIFEPCSRVQCRLESVQQNIRNTSKRSTAVVKTSQYDWNSQWRHNSICNVI